MLIPLAGFSPFRKSLFFSLPYAHIPATFSLIHPFHVSTFYRAKTFAQTDKFDVVYPLNSLLLIVKEGCTI